MTNPTWDDHRELAKPSPTQQNQQILCEDDNKKRKSKGKG